jgi:hypothetical protein
MQYIVIKRPRVIRPKRIRDKTYHVTIHSTMQDVIVFKCPFANTVHPMARILDGPWGSRITAPIL